MTYDNHFTGAITISPPLTWAEIRNGVGVSDVSVRIVEDIVNTETGQTKVLTGDAIVPLEMGTYTGHSVVEDIQAIVDYYGKRHTFAGHIQVEWDPGFGDPVPQRYVVVDGRVETVTPRLVWPGEPVPPADGVPDEWLQAAFDAIGRSGTSDGDEQVRHVVAALLPLMRGQVAGEVEAHAESIGWHEGGGVWADALAVVRQEPWTQPETEDGDA